MEVFDLPTYIKECELCPTNLRIQMVAHAREDLFHLYGRHLKQTHFPLWGRRMNADN